MIKLAFKIVSFFWIVAPVLFLCGRAVKLWDFKGDIFIFLGLMFMSGLSAFLSYTPEDE